jgi:alpha-galactosidase
MFFVHRSGTFFEIHTEHSVYACGADTEGRLRFSSWVSRPSGLEGALFTEERFIERRNSSSQDSNKSTDEVAGYGDEVLQEPSIALSIPHGAVGSGEAAHFPIRCLNLRYRSHRIGTPSQPYAGSPTHGRPTKADAFREWLIIELQDAAYPFSVELCLRAHVESDVIERYLVLINQGDQVLDVEHAWAASLSFPIGRYQATHVCGASMAEFQRQRQVLPIGSTVIESRELISSARHQPMMFLQPVEKANRVTGETYVAQLAWSGNWRIHAEARFDRSLRVHLGEHPVGASFELRPDAVRATPLVLISRSESGEEGAARNLRAFHQACTLPQHEGPRPVLYNSWEATYFDLSFEGQLTLAKQAAAVGCELFVVDDGWFGGRRHAEAGLGDWTVSPEVFPVGLNPLIEAVHGLGMKFGLWFEPEMVNPDSDLYRAHPDWVLHYPGRDRVEARSQLILDFGNPQVVEAIRAQLFAVLDENPIDFIKWDMNRTPKPAGSMAGQGIWRAHVEAVHGLMDALLVRYPKLTIQSCSSGGARADAAMLARCCQVWTSDNTDALQRVQIQDGYILGYPAESMECWVTHESNHQTGRVLPLSLRFASAMRGVLGIGSLLNQLTESELAEYVKWIDLYKRVRHLVQGGVLSRPLLPELDDGISAWQFTSKDGREAYLNVIVCQHLPSQTVTYVKLQNLNSCRLYEVFDAEGALYTTGLGAELMEVGFQSVPRRPSTTNSEVEYACHYIIQECKAECV